MFYGIWTRAVMVARIVHNNIVQVVLYMDFQDLRVEKIEINHFRPYTENVMENFYVVFQIL